MYYIWFLLWYNLLWFLRLSIHRIFFLSEKLFTLVSTKQISRFILIIYKFCNWSASSTIIYSYKIVFSRVLTCSICVCLSSFLDPNCCFLGALYGFTLDTYDGTELGYLEGPDLLFTWSSVWIHTWYIGWYRARISIRLDWRNIRRQFQDLLLGGLLVSVVGLVIGFNKGTVLGSCYGKVLGTTLGALVGI